MTYPTGACNHRWSNDGSKIAIFERLSSGFFGFVIRDAQGTLISEQQKWVVANCDFYAVWPHYNDDVILITRNGGVIEHWVATGDTTEATLQNAWDLPNEGEFRGIDLSPVTETYVLATNMNGTWDIFTGLGNNNLRVTAANESQPRWSPSGEHVVFITDKDGTNDIYVMNVEDRSLRVITASDADDVDPIWSPDGKWIVFASNRNGNYDLYLASATGGESQALLQITTSPLDDRHPEWEPFP